MQDRRQAPPIRPLPDDHQPGTPPTGKSGNRVAEHATGQAAGQLPVDLPSTSVSSHLFRWAWVPSGNTTHVGHPTPIEHRVPPGMHNPFIRHLPVAGSRMDISEKHTSHLQLQ
ncbi:hypothetical protein Dimus_028292 [Dionaea muscipula]